MELKLNQVVRIRKGKNGVVMGFNNKPSLLVFDSFVSPISRYDENLKAKNHDYDIVGVYEGKSVEKYTDVYKKSFDVSTLKEVYVEA